MSFYDYEGNILKGGGEGLTSAEKKKILSLFQNGAFTADMSGTIAELEEMWTRVPATGITLSAMFKVLSGTTGQLTATVTPEDSTDKVVWTSSDPTIASVEDGLITPLAVGNCTITATAGSVSASCALTVNKAVETHYAVNNNLTHATISNTSGKVEIGGSYSATITPDDGYTLSGAEVSVTMGGVDITTTAYSGGVITIESVTGPVVISVVAKEIPSYSVTNNLTGVTTDSTVVKVTEGGSYTANLTVEDGYALSSLVITMGGVDITSEVYGDGYILIAEVTGDVVITAVAEEPVPIETVSADLASETFYDGADDTSTKLKSYTAYGANITSCRATESDCVVNVTIANNTESDISATAYIGAMRTANVGGYAESSNTGFYYSVLAFDGLAIGAGQSRTVQYTLPAGHHLHAYATNKNLTITASGAMDIREIGSDYPLTANGSLTTVYADDTTTTVVRAPGGATKYQTDIFDTDTTVRVTLLSESDRTMNTARCFVCCYNSGNAGYYGKEFSQKLRANMPLTFEYTVRAGYRLATCIESQYVFVENIGAVA